jgi:hypothetical protein
MHAIRLEGAGSSGWKGWGTLKYHSTRNVGVDTRVVRLMQCGGDASPRKFRGVPSSVAKRRQVAPVVALQLATLMWLAPGTASQAITCRRSATRTGRSLTSGRFKHTGLLSDIYRKFSL